MKSTQTSKVYVHITHHEKTIPIGMILEKEGVYHFAYGQKWLSMNNAFSIDPINLPLANQIYQSKKLWPCFEDATPDAWGKRIILSLRDSIPQNPLEWLLASRGDGVGDLRFSKTIGSEIKVDEAIGIDDLVSYFEFLDKFEGQDFNLSNIPYELKKLADHGSSMGGARPKITVESDGVLYLAKFGRKDDVFDQVRAEAFSLHMARDADINVADFSFRVIAGRPVLLLKRFDRTPEGPLHYLSSYALVNPHRVNPNDPDSALSYQNIARIIRKISDNPIEDTHELFRRIVFNILIGNSDDHLKNHGFLKGNGDYYRLSPAFDILPHPESTALQALNVGRRGRESSIKNAWSSLNSFGIKEDDAVKIIEKAMQVIRNRNQYFDLYDVNANDRAIHSKVMTRLKPRVADTHNEPEI